MKKETVIRLRSTTWCAAESLAGDLCRIAEREGGLAWAGWEYPTLKVRIQGMSRARVRAAKKAVTDFAQFARMTVLLTDTEELAGPLPDGSWSIPWGSVTRTKLTKRLLLTLPSGVYIIGISVRNETTFWARLDWGEDRATAWQRAVVAKAAYRLCRVAWSVEQFDEYGIGCDAADANGGNKL